jgi:hypothetical protein
MKPLTTALIVVGIFALIACVVVAAVLIAQPWSHREYKSGDLSVIPTPVDHYRGA